MHVESILHSFINAKRHIRPAAPAPHPRRTCATGLYLKAPVSCAFRLVFLRLVKADASTTSKSFDSIFSREYIVGMVRCFRGGAEAFCRRRLPLQVSKSELSKKKRLSQRGRWSEYSRGGSNSGPPAC